MSARESTSPPTIWMIIIALIFAAAAAIGAHIFHKSAISTAYMLAHPSPHACGKC